MLFGVLLSLLAAFLYAGGNVLQKRAVDRLGPLSFRHHPLRAVSELGSSTPWLAGAVASVLGVVTQIWAFQRVPISVVQSVGVAGTMMLILISQVHFHEKFNRRETLGLVISVAALLMTSLSLIGGESSASKHADYLIFVMVAAASAAFASTAFMYARHLSMNSDAIYAVSSGIFYGLVGLSSKGLSTLIAHGSLSADVGSLFRSPYPYIFLGSWICAVITFQLGIQRGRVGAIGPLSGATSAVYVVAVGTPVFGESLPSSVGASVLRLAGFAAALIGSLLFALGDRSAAVTVEPGNTSTGRTA